MSMARTASLVLAVVILAFPAFGLADDERETTNIAPNGGAEKAKVGYTPVEPGTVRIWDTNKRYEKKRPAKRCMSDKPKWSPVPYRKTDYKPTGDLVFENEHFFLFCFTNKENSVSLIAKLAGTNGGVVDNEIYKVHLIAKRQAVRLAASQNSVFSA